MLLSFRCPEATTRKRFDLGETGGYALRHVLQNQEYVADHDADAHGREPRADDEPGAVVLQPLPHETGLASALKGMAEPRNLCSNWRSSTEACQSLCSRAIRRSRCRTCSATSCFE